MSALELGAGDTAPSSSLADDGRDPSRPSSRASPSPRASGVEAYAEYPDEDGCIGLSGRRYPFKVKLEDRYPMKDPATWTEFEKRYPPDRYGEEASDNARVWKLYRDRVTERDEDQIASWHKTLDILLIFAGLFSAVATAFVIESYQQLQPDYAKLLAQAIVASLNRTDSGSPLGVIPNLDDFQRPPLARGINALWFLSLALALIVALLAILAKQWLGEYTSRMRRHVGSQRRWAWRHFAYFAGLESWGMDGFISALPPLLHVSLFLFLAGLVAFLADLDWVIASLTLALTLIVVVLYIGTTIAPLWYGDCPFATPLLPFGRRVVEWVHSAAYGVARHIHHELRIRLRLHWVEWAPKDDFRRLPAYNESVLLRGDEEARDEKVLEWMASSLPDVDEVAATLDAIGSLDALSHQLARHSFDNEQDAHLRKSDPLCTAYIISAAVARFRRLSDAGTAADPLAVAHCLRTLIVLNLNPARFSGQALFSTFQETLRRWRRIATYDISVLSGFLDDQLPDVTDDLCSWELEAGDATGALPYHPSSLVLLLLELNRNQSHRHDARQMFCSLAGPLASPTIDMRQRRAAYALIASAVDTTRAGTRITPRLDDLKLISTSQQIQVRAMRVLQDLMISEPEGTLDHHIKHMAAIKFESACQAWQNVATLKIEHLDYVKRFVERLDFQRISPEIAQIVLSRFGELVARLSVWSEDLGTLTRHIFHDISQGRPELFPATVLLAYKLVPGFSCTRIRNLFEGAHLSTHSAERHGVVNLLVLGPSAGQSAWDMLWTFSRISECPLPTVARALAIHLCQLKRTGLDVARFAHLLLGNNRGYEIVERYSSVVVSFAQHGREISPQWWEETRTRLLEHPPTDWTGVDLNHPTVEAFIERIETTGNCDECPDRLWFSAVPGTTAEPVESVGRDVGADVSQRLVNRSPLWPRRVLSLLSRARDDPSREQERESRQGDV